MKRYLPMIPLLLATALLATTAQAGETYPIIDAEYTLLVGAWEKPNWLNAETALSRGVNNNRFRLYNLDGLQATATGGQGMFMEPPFEYMVDVPLTPPPAQEDLVGIDCPWEPMPRPVQQAALTQQAYIDATASLLAELGLPGTQVRLTQVLRVDLDGDGTDEVLVSASNYPRYLAPVANGGEYSLAYMRRLEQGRVNTYLLLYEAYPLYEEGTPPSAHTFRAVLDLNGDGVMEIVTQSQYYEGYSLDVWEADKDGITHRLTAGLGV